MPRAGAKLFYSLCGSLFHCRVGGQPQVIVGREIQERRSSHSEVRRLRRVDATQFPVEPRLTNRAQLLLQLLIEALHGRG